MLSTLQLVCLLAFALYLLYYYTCVVRKPWVISSSASMRTFLHVNCGPLVEEPFWPPIWCIGSNIQCLVSLVVQVVAAVRQRFPGGAVLAVGYSMGGMLLSHYLLQTGDASQIDAGLSISAPFHLRSSYDNLMSWSTSYFINLYLANCLMSLIRRNVHVMGASGVIDVDWLLQCRTLYDFDNRYTAPVFGFRNAMEFYSSASLNGKLSTVRRPLLYLLAADDAFGSPKTLPAAEIERSPWLTAVVTPRGGHLGFVDGWIWPRMPFYSERFAAAYVSGLLALARGPLGAKALRSLVDKSVDSLSPFPLAEEKLTGTYYITPLMEDQEDAAAERPTRENKRNQDILRSLVTA